MRATQVSLPELGLIAGTRAALGAGIGLLLAGYLSDTQRRAVGWTLFAVGALTTVPLAYEVLGGDRLRAELSDSEIGRPSRQDRETMSRREEWSEA